MKKIFHLFLLICLPIMMISTLPVKAYFVSEKTEQVEICGSFSTMNSEELVIVQLKNHIFICNKDTSITSTQKDHIHMLFAVILFLIDILLSKHLNAKSLFLVIPNLQLNKIIAGSLFILFIYTLVHEKILVFIIGLTLLRIIDKIIFIAKKTNF